MIIRQAHPGPKAPPYRDYDSKVADARFYAQHLQIPWTVLADDLPGMVHQVYGGLSDPTYLIGSDGRVAHYNIWTNVPTLHVALSELECNGWTGTTKGGTSTLPQMMAAAVFGWPALRRGLPDSYIDLETAAPGLASIAWLGRRFRFLLAPLASRHRPLPAPARGGVAAVAGVLAVGLLLSRSNGKK